MPTNNNPPPAATATPGPGDRTGTLPRTLAETLLSGRGAASIAHETGVVIADSYRVLAVAVRHRAPGEDGPSTGSALWEMAPDLPALLSPQAVAAGTEDGATILVPAQSLPAAAADQVIGRLCREREAPIIAVAADAAPAQIPATARQAWEIMDVVRRLRLPAGLYRLDDLALEYQLTRPGPGRDQLAALLDPLDDHPDLMRMLHIHIANNLNRQRTARALRIHPNTVDYRLKRIGELTGLDAGEAPGLWYLRSALVVRGYTEPDPPL